MNKDLSRYTIVVLCLALTLIGQAQANFQIKTIDQSLYQRMIDAQVFGKHSPVSIDRLRLIKLKYLGFDGQEHDGEIMVLDACSQQVLTIFQDLYDRKFAFERIELIMKYGGSDSLSMAANNTSAHNLRQITGGKSLSLHAYGTAIDINPVNNPFVDISCSDTEGIARFQPAAGIKYANRMENRLGKTNRKGLAEDALEVFSKNGFYWWGGYWNCPIDYQHFQVSRSITELLVAMEPEEAAIFFKQVVAYFNKTHQPIEDALKAKIGKDVSFVTFYKQDKERFHKVEEELE